MSRIDDIDGIGGSKKLNPIVARYMQEQAAKAAEKMAATNNQNTANVGTSVQERVNTEGEGSFAPDTVGDQRQLNTVTTSRDTENDNSNNGGGERDQVSHIKGLVSHESPVSLFTSLALNKISQTLNSWGITMTDDMKQVLERMEDQDPKATMALAKKLPRLNSVEAKEAIRQATQDYIS